jgi:hypothetical protein
MYRACTRRQDRGFLALTLDQVIIAVKNPGDWKLTRAQKAANRQSTRRRVRIEHVNSPVKPSRMVLDKSRLRKAGVQRVVTEVC